MTEAKTMYKVEQNEVVCPLPHASRIISINTIEKLYQRRVGTHFTHLCSAPTQ